MKIVQINGVDGILSTGVTTLQLSKYLTKNGIENMTVCRKDKGSQFSIPIGNKIDYRLHGLLSRLTGLQGCFSIISTIRLLYRLNKFSPDVIHLRNLHENFINIPLLLWYIGKKNIATVITLHDCFFYTGGCTYYTDNHCDGWKTNKCRSCVYLGRTKKYWMGWSARFSYYYKYELFHKIKRLAVIGVSNWVAKEATEAPIFNKAKILKGIYNWIDLDLFTIQSLEEITSLKKQMGLNGKFIILAVASYWVPKKGLTDLLMLASKLPDEYRIIMVGKMPIEVDIPYNIISIPRTYDIRELVKYYNIADVFVHLSIEETFGKVTAESLSCGTPVVVYNSTASPELVADGCGYIINNVGDYEAILSSIYEIRRKGKGYYTNKCREKAELSFNSTTNCRQYIDVYKELLNSI